MAVSPQTNSVSYDGNNSTVTAYPVPFPFLESSHLIVSTLAEDEDESVTLSPSVYTVTRLADGSGGSLRTASAVPATSALTIQRILPLTQPTVFPLAGPLPAPSIETALDRLTMIAQQLAAAIAAVGAGEGGAVVITPPGGDGEATITLAQTTQNLDEAANVRVTATFSGAGAFAEAFIHTHLACNRANAVITPEENKRAAGCASWVIYLKPATSVYGTALPCVLNATVRGKAWSGATSSNVAASWAIEPLS